MTQSDHDQHDHHKLPSLIGLKIASMLLAGEFFAEIAWDIYSKTVLRPGEVAEVAIVGMLSVLCGLLAWGLE